MRNGAPRARRLYRRPMFPRPALLAAFLTVAVVAGSASAQTDPPVAYVGTTAITQEAFDHWMVVAARSSNGTTQIPARGSKRWKALRPQVMQFLISAEWVTGEAARQEIRLGAAAVQRKFEQTRDASFRTRAAFRRFLRKSGMTEADILFRMRLDMYSNRLRRKVTAPYHSARAQQKALDRFVTSFRKRWHVATGCRTGYATPDCGGDYEELAAAAQPTEPVEPAPAPEGEQS